MEDMSKIRTLAREWVERRKKERNSHHASKGWNDKWAFWRLYIFIHWTSPSPWSLPYTFTITWNVLLEMHAYFKNPFRFSRARAPFRTYFFFNKNALFWINQCLLGSLFLALKGHIFEYRWSWLSINVGSVIYDPALLPHINYRPKTTTEHKIALSMRVL